MEGVDYLGVVYTMDHDVVPGPCKICDWLLNSLWDHFDLHQEKKCQSDHGVWGPQKTHVEAYNIHWNDPTVFAVG